MHTQQDRVYLIVIHASLEIEIRTQRRNRGALKVTSDYNHGITPHIKVKTFNGSQQQ